MPLMQFRFAMAPIAALCLAAPGIAQSSASGPGSAPGRVMQLPPDQAAFQAANAHVDKRQRAAALDAFLRDFPKSKRADRARSILLDLLLDQQPRDEKRIHQLAKAEVDAAGKDSRARAENGVAYSLAEALPNGVDLKSAEEWARDAVRQTTLPGLTAQMKDAFGDAKPLTPAEQAKRDTLLKEIYSETQAANLQTLADVYLHEGKLADATATLQQAVALNPVQGANFVTRGQVEHAQQQDSKALEDLETAVVYGGMTPAAQDLLVSIYSAQHGGDRSGLEAEIDRRYRMLYPPRPAEQHTRSSSGRTVLLALYTGSACEPCAAADLATDGVLENYGRDQVVALAFDQHIPEPDPLANAATVARATYDDVHFTPTFRIDGTEAPGIFGRRADADKAYTTLSAALDKELSVASGAILRLTASVTADHTVAARADFQITDANVLQKLLIAPHKPEPASGEASASAEAKKPRTEPKLVLNFALVQREVRYSGENGIRFHAMVVRDLARSTADGFPVALSGSSSASTTFDPSAVSASLSKYLADFTLHNDRFAAPHFLTTDTALPAADLAVAAWVEDLSSHQVVAAAYAPLGGSQTQQASR